jgi:RHS repeat-associated protein
MTGFILIAPRWFATIRGVFESNNASARSLRSRRPHLCAAVLIFLSVALCGNSVSAGTPESQARSCGSPGQVSCPPLPPIPTPWVYIMESPFFQAPPNPPWFNNLSDGIALFQSVYTNDCSDTPSEAVIPGSQNYYDGIETSYNLNVTLARVWYKNSSPVCGYQGNVIETFTVSRTVECPTGTRFVYQANPLVGPYCQIPTPPVAQSSLKQAGPACPGGCGNALSDSNRGAADANTGQTPKADPANVSNGNKYQVETDYIGAGLSPLRFVRTYNSLIAWWVDEGWYTLPAPSTLVGTGWSATYFQYLVPTSVTDGTGTYNGVSAYRPDGRMISFSEYNNVYSPDGDVADRLVQTANGWQYQTADDTIETYDVSGDLVSIAPRGQAPITVSRPNPGDPPSSVSDAYGHTLTFNYADDPAGFWRLSSITDPSGKTITYGYDSNANLTSVTFQDASKRQYSYDPYTKNQLDTLTDEANNAYASWTYNSALVASSQLAGGVDAYSFTYATDANGTITSATVKDPLGQSRTYAQQFILGVTRTTSATAFCPGCGEDASRVLDADGNITSRTDFNGNQTTYVYDTINNLETSRTEAYGTAQARTITTTWDPNWRQPDLVTEQNRTTAFAYDSMGNVLTKTITDTTVTPNATRVWTYTYDSYGRMLTAKGPRTDVNSTTTYAYYTCTTGYQCGQVQTITDPVGHVTTFNTYNAHGQPLTIMDPNGVLVTLTYDQRLRLLSRQIGTETTSYSYYPTGLLETVTLPDSSTITYTYDAAHRLTKITDGAGNYISYTLDNMGNRTAESSYDPSSTLHRTHTRVFNALNELYQDINSAGTSAVTTTLAYDNDGNVTSSAAPLSRNTADQYDALNRLIKITDPNSGITQLGYDANDNLSSVIDPRTFTTSYTHNGFGDVTQLVSPDTGTSLSTYDSGGNLKTATDARSALATYSYDAMNRVTQVAYADQTINFTYDAGTNGIGRLTGASDANHSMSWSYDTHGRVTGKGQTIGTVTKSIGYSYTNGDLASLVTPSGQTIAYTYANHRITKITINGTTLLSTATYDPFGPTTGWTWGNSTASNRSFDKDGNPSQIVTAGVTNGYTIDNASRITGLSDSGLSSNSFTFGYDLLDRVTSGTSTGKTRGYTYDANSNRLTTTGTTASTETVATTSNRLNSTSGGIVRTYGYDNAGNTTSFTGDSFTYNDRGRVSQAIVNGSATNYVYNALGQLVKKSGNGGTTLIVYDEAGHILGEYSSTGALVQETIWMGDLPVATLRPNGSSITIYYVHSDHLGTPRKVTRQSDNGLMWRWDPDTFGSVAPNQNPSGLGSFVYNLRFPGQYSLNESGLYYNYFRDYDPQTGRYIESDPIGLHGGINTYAYVSDSPVNLVDPFGLCKIVLQFSRPLSRIPAYHITVTTFDSNGSMFFVGGPTNTPIAVTKYGYLHGSSGNNPDIDPLSKVIVDDGKPCSCYNNSFLGTIQRTNANDIPYDPLAQNSNSLAGTMLRDAGINVSSASWPYWTPAYSQDLNHFDPFDFLSRSK